MGGEEAISFPLAADIAAIVPFDSLDTAFVMWRDFVESPDELYRDTHCWVFTPASCELVLTDLRFLGLTALEIVELTATKGHEFYVHLKKASDPAGDRGRQDREQFYADRRGLLLRVSREGSPPSVTGGQLQRIIEEQRRQLAELEGRIAREGVAAPFRRLARIGRRLLGRWI